MNLPYDPDGTRSALAVSVEAERVFVQHSVSDEGVTLDEARWLQAVALPAAIAEVLRTMPSDAPANVPGEPDEQIPGQLSIDG